MKLFDFFKKKKKVEKKMEKKVEVRPQPSAPSKLVHGVLLSPHVTEKATDFGKENKYIFKVSQKANKIEIKKAVQALYNVDVEDVKIINIHRKKRRVGRKREGWKKGYKKAIIRLKQGQKIEIMPR